MRLHYTPPPEEPPKEKITKREVLFGGLHAVIVAIFVALIGAAGHWLTPTFGHSWAPAVAGGIALAVVILLLLFYRWHKGEWPP